MKKDNLKAPKVPDMKKKMKKMMKPNKKSAMMSSDGKMYA